MTKVVEGTAPPDAQWVVDITCEEPAEPSTPQMTFTGPGSQTTDIGGAGTCTVVESVTAGASVTYACEVTNNPANAECTGDNEVTFTFTATNFPAATITVTNTYAPPAPPVPSAAPAAETPPAPEPVTAAARLTG